MKVAFLVNDLQLSGGIGVIVEHARHLAGEHDFDVTLVLVREQQTPHWSYEKLEGLHVVALPDARVQRFDVAVATWWETTFTLFSVPADRYAYFVQSLEDRFYKPVEPERQAAALTLGLPVAFITEARWIADTLGDLRPDAPCYLVRNGIDKSIFRSPTTLEPRRSGPLRVLVEGNPSVWFKGVEEAMAATRAMSEPRHVTVVTAERETLDATGIDRFAGPVSASEMASMYAQSDVVLKLSRVEGMYGPPLEGFHMGATCVTTEVTGHDEYIRHGFNALVCDWDDERGTARALDLLARDRRLLHLLRTNALATAHGWPSWQQSGQLMAMALRAIRRAPPPDSGAGVTALMGELRAGLETRRVQMQYQHELETRIARIERVTGLPIVARALALRHRRWAMLLSRPLRRLIQRDPQ